MFMEIKGKIIIIVAGALAVCGAIAWGRFIFLTREGLRTSQGLVYPMCAKTQIVISFD